MRRLAQLVLSGLVLPACVVGTERPASRVDVARTDPDGTAAYSATTGSASPCVDAEKTPPPRPNAGDAVWIDGECRFDGVRHVWHEGRWEPRRATGAPR
jgi:hypothetical protein